MTNIHFWVDKKRLMSWPRSLSVSPPSRVSLTDGQLSISWVYGQPGNEFHIGAKFADIIPDAVLREKIAHVRSEMLKAGHNPEMVTPWGPV